MGTARDVNGPAWRTPDRQDNTRGMGLARDVRAGQAEAGPGAASAADGSEEDVLMRRNFHFLGELTDDGLVEHDRDEVRQALLDLEGAVYQLGGIVTDERRAPADRRRLLRDHRDVLIATTATPRPSKEPRSRSEAVAMAPPTAS